MAGEMVSPPRPNRRAMHTSSPQGDDHGRSNSLTSSEGSLGAYTCLSVYLQGGVRHRRALRASFAGLGMYSCRSTA